MFFSRLPFFITKMTQAFKIGDFMCMFEFANKASPRALLKGMEKFECGSCPECLQKKSRQWALRAAMEMKDNIGMMITLTYDTYKVDKNGNFTNIENPIDPTIPLSKRHCQLFMKRLRKAFPERTIKYIIAAERGKKGRAHYHGLIFGLVFDDLIKYKKSKRGNVIYKSKTLEKIWQHGICTVDSVNPSSKVARYCTKYCAKDSGADETFMLFSHGIGEKALFRLFNGKSYWVEGREYPIPRQIWNKVIEKRYFMEGYSKYVNRVHVELEEKRLFNSIARFESRAAKKEGYPLSLVVARAFYRSARRLQSSEAWYQIGKGRREKFMLFRDSDPQYQEYLRYWSAKARVYDLTRPSVDLRILALPDNKYRSYKNRAILAKHRQVLKLDFVPPRSQVQAFVKYPDKKTYTEKSFAPLPCHYRANDTTKKAVKAFEKIKCKILRQDMEKNAVPLHYLDNPFFSDTPNSSFGVVSNA